MDIKQYLKPRFSDNPFSEAGQPRRVKRDPNVAVKVSGVDFFVTKETPKTKKTLVCIMSQNLLYIRDEKTGVDAMATPELVRSFIGMTDITLVDDETGDECLWLGEINRGKTSAEWLCNMFSEDANKDLKYLFSKGFGYFASTSDAGQYVPKSFAEGATNYFPALFRRIPKEFAKSLRQAMTESLFNRFHSFSDEERKLIGLATIFVTPDAFHLINETPGWGVSGFCDFVEEFFRSAATEFPDSATFAAVLGKNRKYDTISRKYVSEPRPNVPRVKLQNYIFYNGVNECGSDGINGFMKEYGDYLNVREQLAQISHKEYPQFPENLFSAVQRISAVHRKYQRDLAKVSDQEFAEYVTFLKKYEYAPAGSEYVILAPESKSDMLEEAVHQCNCLSSYIKRVKDGECMVFFCRRARQPNRSFVTISVMADGTLDQVLAARNRRPEAGAEAFVKNWHHKFFADAEETA